MLLIMVAWAQMVLEKEMELKVLQQLAVRTARYPYRQSEQPVVRPKQYEATRLDRYLRILISPIQQVINMLIRISPQVQKLEDLQELRATAGKIEMKFSLKHDAVEHRVRFFNYYTFIIQIPVMRN